MNESTAISETPLPPTPAPASRSALLIVFLVVFIDLLGFGIVLPLLPVLGKEFISRAVGTGVRNGVTLGLLMASFSLMQFFFAPMWGRISDRKGRRPILLMGLFGSVAFYALFGFATSLAPEEHAALAVALFFAARIGAGISGATIATAQAVIADCTPPEKRKHGMALIGAAFGIGFTFGPLIGYFGLTYFNGHKEAIGYTAAAISLLAFVLGVVLLPETRRFAERPPIERRVVNFSALRYALTSSALAPVVLVFFLATVGFAGFESTLSLLLENVLKIGKHEDLFPYFAYIGLVLLLTQGFLYRRLAKRLSEMAFMTIGIILMGSGVACLGVMTYLQPSDAPEFASLPWLSTQPVLLVLGLTSAVAGFAFLTPSAQALISRRTDADHQGEILGVNQSAASMARILGPLVFMPLFEMTADHLWPYAFGAALILLMLPLMPLVTRGGMASHAA
jgi:DHA1 family tetracycline resistance protein-like MFS transporter